MEADDGASADRAPGAAPAAAGRRLRLALITAGQSPRSSIVRDLLDALPDIAVTEFGALDGLQDSDIVKLYPAPGEPSVVSRLRNGQYAMFSRAAAHEGIQAILSGLKPDEFDLAAIFCAGTFDDFPPFVSACRMIQSQPALENAVRMLVSFGHKIGVIQPFARQVDEIDTLGVSVYQRRITWLDPTDESDWARVVAESADCEALVLNSLNYDEETAVRLRRETGMPVILPRRVLASAIRLVIDVDHVPQPPTAAASLVPALIERLTPRERQVMWLMVDGLQTKQISRQLDISPNTVNIHRTNILAKLQVPTTTSLARLILGRVG